MYNEGDILAVDKPVGMTSHDVVSVMRRATGIRRIGHAGTLDPTASGVLVVLIGRSATKRQAEIMGQQKGYDAEVTLGATSNTDDAEGEVVQHPNAARVVNITKDEIERVLQQFIGTIQQTPPIFSALKKDGQPLYKKARKGEAIEVQPREVTIHSVELRDWTPPKLRIHVECGSGTYIRSLARDIGEQLKVGGYLTALRRTHVGEYTLENSVQLPKFRLLEKKRISV